MYNHLSTHSMQPIDHQRLTPKQLIRKHILDPNHVVTEEEVARLDLNDHRPLHEAIEKSRTSMTRR